MTVEVKPHPHFPEIYWATLEDGSRKLGTKNLVPGNAVYGERLVRFSGYEYRLWDPYRSKLAAAILKGLEIVPICPNYRVLYLGAASGTTASHVSDIVGEDGQISGCYDVPVKLKHEVFAVFVVERRNRADHVNRNLLGFLDQRNR